jgi:putative methionine-R-sulfoxide reductase with GAF domain
MKKLQFTFPENMSLKARNTFNITAVLLGVLILFDIYSTYNYLTLRNQTQLFAFSLSYAMTAASMLGAWMSWHGREHVAGWLLIAASLISLLLSNFLGSGLGIIYAVTGVVVVSALANSTLDKWQAGWAIIISFVVGILGIFIDIYLPREVISNPIPPTFTYFMLGLLILGELLIIRSQFSTYSLRTKLITVIVSIAVISIGTVSFVTDLSVTSQLNKTSKDSLNTLASATSDQIVSRLLQNKDRLNILALNKFIQDNTERGFNTATNNLLVIELIELQGSYTNFTELVIVGADGKLISSTNIFTPLNQADQTYWQAAWNDGEGATYISEPFFDENAGSYVIRMAIPISAHGEENLVGVVAANINLREFADILAKNQADLLFANSQIMGHESLGLIQNLATEDLAALATLTEEGFEEINYEGEANLIRTADVTSADAAIQNLNWTVIVHKEVAEVRTPIESATRILFLTAIGILLVVVLIAFIIGNQFLHPIESLTTAAKKLAEGDFTAKANVTVTDELGTLANSFNIMSAQVNDLITTLEQRVTDRTKALSTSTEVSRRLSTILDEKQLVSEVVTQVQNAFDYYHVHIYLMDDKQEKLIMAGGTGEAGQVMLRRGHFIQIGKGLVGRAGETNSPILVSDTVNNPDWLPNPLLPDTRSEIAVPISLANQVLGVLDVQQNIVDGLKREDVDLLQSIANQAAVALQNSRTLVNAQERVSREQLIASINQKILSENSVESAMQVAVREIGRALGTRAQIKLKTPDSEN